MVTPGKFPIRDISNDLTLPKHHDDAFVYVDDDAFVVGGLIVTFFFLLNLHISVLLGFTFIALNLDQPYDMLSVLG